MKNLLRERPDYIPAGEEHLWPAQHPHADFIPDPAPEPQPKKKRAKKPKSKG